MRNKGLMYIIIMLIDFIICSIINAIQLKKEKLEFNNIFIIILLNNIGIIIGSKILDFAVFYKYYINYDIVSSLTNGWMFLGGVVCSTCLTTTYCYFKKYNTEKIIGIIFSNYVLLYSIGKIRCFLNGCCYGLEYYGPFNVSNRFPIQIVESIYCFVFYWYLQIKKNKFSSIKEALLWYCMLILGMEKIVFLPFRGNSEVVSNCANFLIAIAFIIIGIFEIKHKTITE